MTTKLDKLLQKEAQLKAQIQDAKARERTLERKKDTRRKILVGAAVMARVERGDWPDADLKIMMDGFLSRENERELFGLDGAGGVPGAASASAVKANDGTKRKAGAKAVGAGKGARALPVQPVDVDNEFNL